MCPRRWILFVALPIVSAVCLGPATAQGAVPTATYVNGIAGVALDLPEDWEMCTGDLGNTMMALDADAGVPTAAVFPVLWFFRTAVPPAQMAREIAQGLTTVDQSSPQVRDAGGGAWVVTALSHGPRGTLREEWHCRQEGGTSYVVATMVKPQFADRFAADLSTALQTCHLAPTPPLKLFTEPSEQAYRMILPATWRWEGHIIRNLQTPGYFEWMTQSNDGLTGAFSAPPGVFNITMPYLPAGAAASQIVLPALQQKYPGMRLESVQELPRPGQYYEAAIKALGIGDHPRAHKARADYLMTRSGVTVRVRVNIATVMLNASPLLGGRGDWMLFTSGYWAPADRFDQLAPLGRGVLASVMTDANFKRSQFAASNEVAVSAAWNRDLSFWRFMVRLWSN